MQGFLDLKQTMARIKKPGKKQQTRSTPGPTLQDLLNVASSPDGWKKKAPFSAMSGAIRRVPRMAPIP